MATTLQPVDRHGRDRRQRTVSTAGGAGHHRMGRRLKLLPIVPWITLAIFLGPLAIGLIATIAPSLGYMPALGGTGLSLDPWRSLLQAPQLPAATTLTLWTGIASTLISLVLAVGIAAAAFGTRAMRIVQGWLAPLLALPHAALAIGLAMLIAPSGFLARLISPWATGWDRPVDMAIVQDPAGLALIGALVIKETPFLLLMILAAQAQSRTEPVLCSARTMGYGPMTAWLKTVLPLIYPQIRLPLFAVLAYSLSVVDMAMILAPTTPPTLAVVLLSWFNDPDLSRRFQAAAGACLQLGIVALCIGAWMAGERLLRRPIRTWLVNGRRGGRARLVRPAILITGATGLALALGSVATLGLWSLATRWRYPDALPGGVSLDTWMRVSAGLAEPLWTTITVALASAVIALALSLACLENEQRRGRPPSANLLWLLYLPLLVPQVGFLFGVQVFLIQMNIDGVWVGLLWSHLLFVVPYVFLTVSDPYRRLDERYARTAACLGARPARIFWRIKLPLLLRSILVAAAIGVAVSVGQYLPTVFAGAGRLSTITTEAVQLAAGGDRRVIGAFAFVQAVLPWIAFALAMALPAWLYRNRKGLAGGSPQ